MALIDNAVSDRLKAQFSKELAKPISPISSTTTPQTVTEPATVAAADGQQNVTEADSRKSIPHDDTVAHIMARDAAKTGNVDNLKLRANENNAAAQYYQYYLGLMYANGQGVPQDNAEALKWLHKAADQGNAAAQYNLGAMYAKGQGVPQDNAEALQWISKAADQGFAAAQFNLGAMYADGLGVPKSDIEAVPWFRMAADQGYADAQYALGRMYDTGRGVPQDKAEALQWLRKAADQGNAKAMTDLAAVANGQGVAQDNATPTQPTAKSATIPPPASNNTCGEPYPCQLDAIIDHNDWDAVQSAIALVTQMNISTKVKWTGKKNNHHGYVLKSGNDNDQCKAFDVFSYMGSDTGKASVTACQNNGNIAIR